jgi:hypothetical protein
MIPTIGRGEGRLRGLVLFVLNDDEIYFQN